MQLLKDVNIKSFLKLVWTSEKAHSVWESVINDCAQFVQELEIDSVESGQRKCAWRTIDEESLPGFTKQLNDKNLIVTPVRYVGKWEGFIHYTPPVEKGKPKNVYCIISKTLWDAKEYRRAFEAGDNIQQGLLLGFPQCCVEFFDKNWKAGYFDPIWQIGHEEIAGVNSDYGTIRIKKVHPYSNPVLRYITIRIGFHIPCSFYCKETIKIATERMKLAEKKNKELTEFLKALLSMPMSWNCYNGIAIIRTPIFYIITSSMPTVNRHVIELEGKWKPKESAKGLCFPFRS
ncbi:MAG: hypothetical protein ACFFDN_14025 [Candidatus Hodarchaeota archaeon]